MTSYTIRVLIELESGVEPINGTLQEQPDGEITPFTGWLQLTQALETVRRSPAGSGHEGAARTPRAARP